MYQYLLNNTFTPNFPSPINSSTPSSLNPTFHHKSTSSLTHNPSNTLQSLPPYPPTLRSCHRIKYLPIAWTQPTISTPFPVTLHKSTISHSTVRGLSTLNRRWMKSTAFLRSECLKRNRRLTSSRRLSFRKVRNNYYSSTLIITSFKKNLSKDKHFVWHSRAVTLDYKVNT